jgi:hypothetical protein
MHAHPFDDDIPEPLLVRRSNGGTRTWEWYSHEIEQLGTLVDGIDYCGVSRRRDRIRRFTGLPTEKPLLMRSLSPTTTTTTVTSATQKTIIVIISIIANDQWNCRIDGRRMTNCGDKSYPLRARDTEIFG